MKRFIASFVLLFCVLFGQSQVSGMVGANDQKNNAHEEVLILKEKKIIKSAVFKDSVIKCSIENQTVSEGSYYVLVIFVFVVMLLLVEECLMFFTSNRD